MYDQDAINISKAITNNVVCTLEGFEPKYPDDTFDTDTSILLLHNDTKLTITKERSQFFDWTIDTMSTVHVLSLPRQRYIGLVLPIQRIKETPTEIVYNSLVIEPIFDARTFRIDI
jgi:hypothetical protein